MKAEGGSRILVVDDNQTNLDLLVYLLSACGYEPVGCSSAEEGLDVLSTQTIALVLCDVLMPAQDGYAFARTVKANRHLRAVPLIAVTALAMPEDRKRALEAGFDGYVSKPIEPTTLVAEIRRYVKPRA